MGVARILGSIFRLLRMVDVADGLPQQIARLGQEGPCGIRLDTGPSFSQDFCAVHDLDQRRDFVGPTMLDNVRE